MPARFPTLTSVQPDLNRLQAQLQVSEIKIKDNPTFQVINQLIVAVRQLQKILNSNINTGSSTISVADTIQFLLDSSDGGGGEDGLVIPGPVGPTGATGSQGPMGPMGAIIFPPDAEDGDIFPPLQGPQGNQGVTGAEGPLGLSIFVEDGLPGEDAFPAMLVQGIIQYDFEVLKRTDQTVTNNGTPQDDTELVFAALASSVYLIDFYIIYSGNNATGDYLWNFTYGSTLTVTIQMFGWQQSPSATLGSVNPTGEISGSSIWPSASQSAGTDAAHTKFVIIGQLRITTEAAANIQFKFSNNSAAAGRESTTRAGSILRVKKLF